MRGVTSVTTINNRIDQVSIHTPHAGSDGDASSQDTVFIVSIHTPHAGSDLMRPLYQLLLNLFQSTLPMRGVTFSEWDFDKLNLVSIHTPHAGSDLRLWQLRVGNQAVSIHTPHAGSD